MFLYNKIDWPTFVDEHFHLYFILHSVVGWTYLFIPLHMLLIPDMSGLLLGLCSQHDVIIVWSAKGQALAGTVGRNGGQSALHDFTASTISIMDIKQQL